MMLGLSVLEAGADRQFLEDGLDRKREKIRDHFPEVCADNLVKRL